MQDRLEGIDMDRNTMVVRNTLIASIAFVFFFAVGMGTVIYYHEQEGQQMEACVKAGKQWTKIKVENVAGSERVCIDK
jgi:hypothetical protein